jgi:hypothetical protein
MENIFLDTARIFRALDFEYIDQFLAAMLPMIVTVILHGQGMRLAGGCYRRFGPRAIGNARRGPHVILLVAIVAIMLATHFIEVVAWAVFYYGTGMMADVKSAMYFSVNSYTTLGASNLTLEGRWKGLDGFEAMTAMLMFGWSTAMLAAILQKSLSLDDD